jgi:hypothetical protein
LWAVLYGIPKASAISWTVYPSISMIFIFGKKNVEF